MANFIRGAIKHPDQLHHDLGVPVGQTIPMDKLHEAAKRKDKVGERARFGLELEAFHQKVKP